MEIQKAHTKAMSIFVHRLNKQKHWKILGWGGGYFFYHVSCEKQETECHTSVCTGPDLHISF